MGFMIHVCMHVHRHTYMYAQFLCLVSVIYNELGCLWTYCVDHHCILNFVTMCSVVLQMKRGYIDTLKEPPHNVIIT